ncbi:general stress protein [Georgenia sp. SYP-B2076]|uniref:general stress protein n=1 Tax=Georgenia sp. SYP-B2076 TaxID=2495881 RepID=UPI00197AC782|nr:general stress protein [Georgenia sp. SYP-B2076]
MAQTRRQNDPRIPTLPTGDEIASYGSYLEAQQAVDHLSDQAFDVRKVTIVGTDLRMVERITGRLTYARVAGAGAMSGAWFGLMISLLFYLFSPGSAFPIPAGILIGAAFGILFAVVSYAFTGGKRDFTSASQVVASRYSVLCASEQAGEARQLLMAAGRGATRPVAPRQNTASPSSPPNQNPYAAPTGYVAPPVSPARPAATDAADVPPSQFGSGANERPRYGVRLDDLQDGAGGTPGQAAPQQGEEPGGPQDEAGQEHR